jgi:glycerate kinase
MRVVAAVSGWPGDDVLEPRAAALAVGEAWLEAAPGSAIEALPVGDGGPRTADAWPGGRSLVGGAEVAEYRGDRCLAPGHGAARWNPMDLSAALLGIAAAGATGAVVIPVGDDAPVGDPANLWGGALPALRNALRHLDLVVIATSTRPLLGFHGMSASLIDGREGDAALAMVAQEQERRWTEIAREGDAVGGRESLLGPARLSDQPGTGAAGGLSYALAALGARIVPASVYLAEASGLVSAAVGADLVLGVGGDLNPSALDNGVAASVATAAARAGVPATMLSTAVRVGRRDLMAAGLASAHESAPGPAGLVDGVRRVAHTWTPR